MAKSKVKWFDGKKGYGFILNPDGGEDLFVHFSSIIFDQGFKVLNQDAEVEYDLEKTQKGFQAKNVRELSAPLDAVIPGVEGSAVRSLEQSKFDTVHH